MTEPWAPERTDGDRGSGTPGCTPPLPPSPARRGPRTRTELLDAAERVVLRDGPSASMNAIATEAGITKPILYRHFGDKAGLYVALADRHIETLLDLLREALTRPGPAASAPRPPSTPGCAWSRATRRCTGSWCTAARPRSRRSATAWRCSSGASATPWPPGIAAELGLPEEQWPRAPGLGPRHRRHGAGRQRLVARRAAVRPRRPHPAPGRSDRRRLRPRLSRPPRTSQPHARPAPAPAPAAGFRALCRRNTPPMSRFCGKGHTPLQESTRRGSCAS